MKLFEKNGKNCFLKKFYKQFQFHGRNFDYTEFERKGIFLKFISTIYEEFLYLQFESDLSSEIGRTAIICEKN